jgi:hypothetical protein
MSNELTTEIAEMWLGNRGLFYSPKEITVYDDWIFVRELEFANDPDAEIDCYKWDNSMFAEPWDDISVADSPFIKNNQERVSERVIRLEKEYQKYLKEYC